LAARRASISCNGATQAVTGRQTGPVTDLAGFLVLSIVVIVTPGPDTALTIRNTLLGGRVSGIATAAGVALGQAMWSVATSAGVVALLIAAEPAFVALKLAGAAYLVFLGAQALWLALRPRRSTQAAETMPRTIRLQSASALRQGMISNLTNPKMAVFFPSLLPQFVSTAPSFVALLALGLVFCLMTVSWLTLYAFVVARAGDVLRRAGVRRVVEGVTGAVLVTFGIRVATTAR
jgi:threonine/homoserine/homoserine lactone efflux protein